MWLHDSFNSSDQSQLKNHIWSLFNTEESQKDIQNEVEHLLSGEIMRKEEDVLNMKMKIDQDLSALWDWLTSWCST